jgi:hypothetical protein
MRLLSSLLLALLLALPARAATPPEIRPGAPPAAGLMWIGNSFFYYNNGLPAMVRGLADAAKQPPVRGVMITMGGSGFDWHDVASYFRPDAVGRYSFVGDNVIQFNPKGQLYDIAVLMDCSQCPLHPQLRDSFQATGRQHAATVRANGARPVFFMSWAYADQPDMTAPLAEAYTQLGNATGALVIPAGLAFARAHAERPETPLYVADKRHPTLAGSYLAAAVSYAALYGASPEGNAFTAGLDPAVAAYLQRIAAETVRAYYR